MHIGFDISQTGRGKAGCGYYAHAMIGALLEAAPAHHYSLYPGFGDFYFDPLMPLANPYRGRDTHYGPRHLTREAAARFWNAPDLESALGRPDVVHANNFWCPTRLASSRVVYTCYDLGFTVDPGWTTEANRVGCFEGMFRSAASADWVVAISQATRADYLDTFPHFPQDRIRVIPPCSRFESTDGEGRRPAALAAVAAGGFWLSVGTIEPRKNQRMLAHAYARYLALGGPPLPLVLAGGKGWLMEDFGRELDALGIAAHVIFAGYVDDDELRWLYRHCFANLYPSHFEGFGLPVLEGMQLGAASIVSDASSLPEVAGKAALLLPPGDGEAWAQAMLRLTRDEDERVKRRGDAVLQAAHFDRRTSANALVALYEEAVAAPKRFGSDPEAA
jgi:glycosyltransferase involved in cell wall biosynthesis